jgi:hypothetical protein
MSDFCAERTIKRDFLGRGTGPDDEELPSSGNPLHLQPFACVRPNPEKDLITVWKAPKAAQTCRDSFFVEHQQNPQHMYPMASAAYDDPRVWTPDLGEAIYEYQRSGPSAEWNVYNHMRARQLNHSFLNAGVLKRKDKYARIVPSETVTSMHESQQYSRDKERETVRSNLERRDQEKRDALQQLEDYQKCVYRY